MKRFSDHLLNGPYRSTADMNEDGVLNGRDVAPFVAAVQASGGVQAVPEPVTVWLTFIIGTTFDLFNWDGVVPTGTFAEIVTEAEAVWNTSNLYTTGEVTLFFAVPKPSTFLLALVALGLVGGWRKWGV